MARYMLDTNIFNLILDGILRLEDIDPFGEWFACAVQAAELRKASGHRRLELIAKFEEVRPTMLPSSAFMFDTLGAGFDEAEWNGGTSVPRHASTLNAHPKSKKKSRKARAKAPQDALIIETAEKHGLTVVTSDEAVYDVARMENIPTMWFNRDTREFTSQR